MKPNPSVEFFDTQFRRQVAAREFALNPFETRALPFLAGRVLDLGCGLGNLSLEAGRRGCRVTAVDGSAAAIERLGTAARQENLPIEAVLSDLADYRIEGRYDTIVAIGVLMFFRRDKALALLQDIQEHAADGGTCIVNVLAEGTTFMGMFAPDHYCLFGKAELRARFAGWDILADDSDRFPAPENTWKVFSTLIARKNRADRGPKDYNPTVTGE